MNRIKCYFKSKDKLDWLAVAARNLCLAEEMELDIFTNCSGCTATLSETYHLLEDEERRDKVMEEREAILQFMGEIEAKKRQVFLEAFNSIATNFEVIFAKLSPGGVGKLLLENEEDPFEGGLDIEAKPTGKEVAVIDSMSGGEKALTALAFIFAVQAYKPSPFYILDEIDAHLDDLNTGRLAELLKENSSEAQFLMVSLKDVMVYNADKIYGVFAQQGRSKVVALPMKVEVQL